MEIIRNISKPGFDQAITDHVVTLTGAAYALGFLLRDARLLTLLSGAADGDAGPARQPRAAQRITAILMKSDLRLTLREVEVCTGILLGRTVEAIALDLGIQPASVATYRKRAYRRLGIAAQNQLFALCFNELAAR